MNFKFLEAEPTYELLGREVVGEGCCINSGVATAAKLSQDCRPHYLPPVLVNLLGPVMHTQMKECPVHYRLETNSEVGVLDKNLPHVAGVDAVRMPPTKVIEPLAPPPVSLAVVITVEMPFVTIEATALACVDVR